MLDTCTVEPREAIQPASTELMGRKSSAQVTRSYQVDVEHTMYDAVIIGAGINGSGIARDAAARGLKVLVLDKGDIAGGTTSYSTRLIHGGLRYLEYLELGLVRESLRERERLFHIAPHLVSPLALAIPLYSQASRSRWAIRAGMVAYDLLSLGKSVPGHRLLSRNEVRRRIPGLNAEGLQGAALYYDAQVEHAERLAVENALCARRHGAVFLTHARVDRFQREGNALIGVHFTDLCGGLSRKAMGRVFVNVAGPWVDGIERGLFASRHRLIGGTKGAHIVVGSFPEGPTCGLYTEANVDRRPFFIIPWCGCYLIGTTDERYDGDLDDVRATDSEVEYLLEAANHVLPDARLTRDSVLFGYAGVRPLPYTEGAAPRAITRRHLIHDHAPELRNLLSIVGGKLTTYRELAQQTVDQLFRKLGKSPPPCTTARRPLPGAGWLVSGLDSGGRSLSAQSRRHLLEVYGRRAGAVVELARGEPDLLRPFDEQTGAVGAEVLLAVREEMAQTMSDILLRRSMVGLRPGLGLAAAPRGAAIAKKYLGWTQERVRFEIDSYCEEAERLLPACRARRFSRPAGESHD